MVGHELWLPEPAIERIQDFLNSKEAAQTTILSKSWYNVWLIGPNLDFVQADHIPAYYKSGLSAEEFNRLYRQGMEQFLEFASKTLKRYEESNIKIDSFSLCMDCRGHYYVGEWGYGLDHTKLILRALKIGASHFTLYLRDCLRFVLPDEVFGLAEDLTLIRCEINPRPLVTCNSRLQSLILDEIEFENSDPISNILLTCPLIQHLSLYDVSMVKPTDFHAVHNGGYYDNYPTNDNGYITKPLMWLTTLVLKDVYFDMLFLGDLSSKFPLLKDLTLSMSLKKHQEEILISSSSLERLYFRLKNDNASQWWRNRPYKRQMVTLDFPSIRKFTYVGSVIPLLSIESNSRGYWESHLSIRRRHKRRHKRLTTSWFSRLNDFLTKLRRSKVSLSLRVQSQTSFDYEVGEFQGLPTNEIENLIIDHQDLSSLTCYALLDGLFRMCHPKLITQCVSKCFRVKKKYIELLGHILFNRVLLDCEKTMLTRSHFMYGLNDLKEASAQIIDKSTVSTRRDVPLNALLEHLKTAKGKQEVCFRLSWQPTTTCKKSYLKMSNQKIEELENDRVKIPDKEKDLSTIEEATDCLDVNALGDPILENSGSGELVSKIKHLLKLLLDGFPESNNVDDANKFSCMLYEVFREPCFVNALHASIEKGTCTIDSRACRLSNNRSPTERVARMKADYHFKPTLMILRFDTTNFNTIRVFLKIFLGHWSDEVELRELDKRLRKLYFGDRFDRMHCYNAKKHIVRK